MKKKKYCNFRNTHLSFSTFLMNVDLFTTSYLVHIYFENSEYSYLKIFTLTFELANEVTKYTMYRYISENDNIRNMSAVEINNISCSIGSSQVLVKASLKINHGSIYCLLGPSVRIFPNFIWKSSRSHICYFSNPFEKITFYFDSLILMC